MQWTREYLRQQLITNAEQAAHRLWRFMSSEQQTITTAALQADPQNIPAINDYLDYLCGIINKNQFSSPAPHSQKGETMAQLCTLKNAATKAAFSRAGVTLTQYQEHVCALAEATGFDWIGLVQKLGQIAVQVLPIIIGIFAGNQPAPVPPLSPVNQGIQGASCCDHHDGCCDTLRAILRAAEMCSKHLCECCC